MGDGITAAGRLFPEESGFRTTGILPYQALKNMRREREIVAVPDLDANQIQPASIDLRLGEVAYRVRASFLPGPGATVDEKIKQLDTYPIDITNGAVLERGCVYVIPLQESLSLKHGLTGFANPKSSTGRLDILTRLITDRSSAFDRIGRGYQGPLYVEVAPRTFSVVVRTGTRLNQVRFRRGSPIIAATELQRLHAAGQLALVENGEKNLRDGKMLPVTVDLHGAGRDSLIGYRAKKHTDRIDVERVGYYDWEEFWEPIFYRRDPPLILDPNDFYILVTREAVKIPPEFAAEMVAYETSVGEFRVHYAGFFDPGFGWGDTTSKAVLEVRSHEVPFMLDDGQTVGFLQYERMLAPPDQLYGAGMKSSYQGQSLALAKQFRRTPT
jgi:dCTP deaminase